MLKKSDRLLADILLEKKLVTREKLDNLLKEAEASKLDLTQVLVKHAVISERDILTLLADKLKLSCVDLSALAINKSIFSKIPVKVASYYKFLPIDIKDRLLTIAVSSPLDIKTQDEIRTQLGLDIEMLLVCDSDIAEGIKNYYGDAADTFDKMASGAAKPKDAEHAQGDNSLVDIEKLAGDASVIKLVNQIIFEAYRKRATDIHIEPYRNGVAIRYRIDGILYDAPAHKEAINFLSAIISRIKIMSNLNIVERRLPQDGRAVVRVQDHVLDLRISTIPTPHGESVVIRILPTKMLFSLEKLGLPKSDMKIFVNLLEKPHGIIFVTGPTGSGKTTTLYTCLSKINTKDRKIITIEDPIEYEIEGITQIQVVPEIGFDFARGLRSILRHDPDVIMVGEVRDLETAEIAIRVALTGHLVFSTLHTNDAASGVTRLVDIGVEPYLVTSSVEAFIAQRLVRVICEDCKHEDKTVPVELVTMIAKESGVKTKDIKIFRGKGCPSCNNTGFFGRTAIYEMLLIDDVIRDLILKKVSTERIKKAAVSHGMRTLRQDGWLKVMSGMTTPEEVLNITAEESQGGAIEKDEPFYEKESQVEAPPASSGASSAVERRAYPRVDTNLPLKYKIFKSPEDVVKKKFAPEHISRVANISAGGIAFLADEACLVGSIAEVSIDLQDDGPPIACLSRVVVASEAQGGRGYNIAVCFLDITGAERTRLSKYVNSEAGRH